MTQPLPILDWLDLFTLAGQSLPAHVTAGWATAGSETYRAYARQFERVMSRVAEAAESVFILQATGSSRATALVEITRTDTTERVGWREGQLVCQTRWGIRYESAADVEFGVGVDTLEDVPIRAELSGWDGNVDVRDIARWALPTGVDRKTQINWLPGVTESAKDTFLAEVDEGFDWRLLDPTLDAAWIHATTDAAGGSLATLDMLGQERGLMRTEGEVDTVYRRRIRTLPDTVTPAAILRAVETYLEGLGVTVELLEPWEYGFAFGADPEGAFETGGPFVTSPSFLILISGLDYDAVGFAFEVDPNGAFETGGPFETGDPVHDGVIAGLLDLLRQIKPAGVCTSVLEVF